MPHYVTVPRCDSVVWFRPRGDMTRLSDGLGSDQTTPSVWQRQSGHTQHLARAHRCSSHSAVSTLQHTTAHNSTLRLTQCGEHTTAHCSTLPQSAVYCSIVYKHPRTQHTAYTILRHIHTTLRHTVADNSNAVLCSVKLHLTSCCCQ